MTFQPETTLPSGLELFSGSAFPCDNYYAILIHMIY